MSFEQESGTASHVVLHSNEVAPPQWFAAYTSSRHEKKVAEQLRLRAIEHYLPLYCAERRWNKRRVTVEEPLFPGYVFVRLPLTARLRVLEIHGVSTLVSRSGVPLALPEDEVERVRRCLSLSKHAQPHPYVGPGTRVHIVGGPLAGLEGVVTRQDGRTRFVLSVDLIMRSIAVNVDARYLQAASSAVPIAA